MYGNVRQFISYIHVVTSICNGIVKINVYREIPNYMFYSLVGDHDHKPHIMIVSLSPDTMFTIIYPRLGRFLGQFLITGILSHN
jgi:hypothetical protein